MFALAMTSLAAESLVTTDCVNFRTGPSLSAGVISTISAGKSVEILEHDPAGWSKVKAEGTTGYIRSDFLAAPHGTQPTVFRTTDAVNFRRAPSLDAEVFSTLPCKTNVDVLEHDPAGWSNVKVDGKVGYIRSDFLAISSVSSGVGAQNGSSTGAAGSTGAGSSNSANASAASSSGSAGASGNNDSALMRTNDAVNFRAAPSMDADIIKVLSINTEVHVIAHESNGWSNVTYDGTNGYIRSDLLSTSGRNVELLEWSVVKTMIKYSEIIPVYDVRTGLTYNIKCFSVGGHADVEPVTKADTDVHSQTFNGIKSWSARPVWVTIGGHTIAASLHGMPHDVSTIPDNGMNGHICLHFLGSTAGNSSESYKKDLQNAVQEAWNAR